MAATILRLTNYFFNNKQDNQPREEDLSRSIAVDVFLKQLSHFSNPRKDFENLRLTSRMTQIVADSALNNYCFSSLKTLQKIHPDLVERAINKLAEKGNLHPSDTQVYLQAYNILKNDLLLQHGEWLNKNSGASFVQKIKNGFSLENALEMYRVLDDFSALLAFEKIDYFRRPPPPLNRDITFMNLSRKAEAMRVYLAKHFIVQPSESRS